MAKKKALASDRVLEELRAYGLALPDAHTKSPWAARVLPTSPRPLVRIVVAILVILGACSKKPAPDHHVIDDFRAVERTTLQTFNDLLRQQRANAIDELGLAEAIDQEVLPPWRELRGRIDAAPVPEGETELYTTLRRYVAERQTAWEAYSAALRSPTDEAAKPHYATYHEQNDAATADAKRLGEAFRALAP